MGKNLVVILSDEHQAKALGCAGHPFVQTPNLDKLASKGMRFNNAYTPSPICVPARASFATGQYVHQTGHWDNAMAYAGTPLGWGHQLQDASIRVESIGKLHYRSEKDAVGFDKEHIPMMIKDGVGMVWASIRQEDKRIKAPGRMLGDNIGAGESSYTRYDQAVTSCTIEWLRKNKNSDTNWCLYVGLVAPHFPLTCPEKFYDLYAGTNIDKVKQHPNDGYQRHPWVELQNQMANSEAMFKNSDERKAAFYAYYGLTSWLDNNIGQIMNTLDETGLSETTTVIYSSDHGDNVGERGLWGKSNMYEESVAIPLIMSGPNIQVGICETPVSLIDFSATIPDFFGLAQSDTIKGRPLTQICQSAKDATRVIFSEYHAVGGVSGAFMIRKGSFKLIHYVGFEPELFNLEEDPYELVNLATNPNHSEVLASLYHELHFICDPTKVNKKAHIAQENLVISFGGLKAVQKIGPKGATPPPVI